MESCDRALSWAGARGTIDASGGQASEKTPFFIASIDKLLNAAVAMLLSETGRLDLDNPIAACLPGAMLRGLHRHQGSDHSGSITVRHLLTHTSGLADWLEDHPKGGPSLVERVLSPATGRSPSRSSRRTSVIGSARISHP